MEHIIKPIAYIKTGFPEKFGVPRQSGLVKELTGEIVFEPEFRSIEAVRGLDGFSHIWLIWQFSENIKDGWHPTVRPPRLGGNTRLGVFATRSPFRPNGLGLSCVKLEKIDLQSKNAPILTVSGIDLIDNTPIFDIKPYIPTADRVDASDGFTENTKNHRLEVIFSEEAEAQIPTFDKEAIIGLLSQDPRPGYDNDPEKQYGVFYKENNIIFTVDNNILTVISINKSADG